MRGDGEGGEEELALDVLVEIVHPRHVRRAVAHHEVGQPRVVALAKEAEHLIYRLLRRDVSGDE